MNNIDIEVVSMPARGSLGRSIAAAASLETRLANSVSGVAGMTMPKDEFDAICRAWRLVSTRKLELIHGKGSRLVTR